MSNLARHPFPDYVICPYCGEPEVEVWCYAVEACCHACGQMFAHALPLECTNHCDRVACVNVPTQPPVKFN